MARVFIFDRGRADGHVEHILLCIDPGSFGETDPLCHTSFLYPISADISGLLLTAESGETAL
jgi:hypothetical protein